ncbi:MAG: hypothetical protein F6K31_07195 [Symploca sp. SIO2G7]|nr:hypothetical protein [Symploca sp. SIO2G7]
MTQLTTEQAQQLKDIVIRLCQAEKRIDQAIDAYNDALIYRFGKRVSLAEDAYNEIVEEGNKLLTTINPEFFSLETAWVRENLEVTLNPPLINWEDLAKKLEEQDVCLDELYEEKQKPLDNDELLPLAPEEFPTEQEIEALRRVVRAWVPEGSSKDFCDGFLAGLILYPEMRLILKPHLVPLSMDLLKDRCESVPQWRRCDQAAE